MSINRRLGVPMATGDEHDALSPRSKKMTNWRAGVRKALKRAFNRRVRRRPVEADEESKTASG
jgi:hypothetical protein